MTLKPYLGVYSAVLKAHAEKKKKKELIALDKWMQNDLKKSIVSRSPPHLEKDELAKLMKWKLTRGKFRPRLTELVQTNSQETITSACAEGFGNIDKPDVAIKALSKLNGVGPATASAILAVYSPESFAFMADEAVQSLMSGKIDYNAKYYLRYLDSVQKRVKSLQYKEPTIEWTAHKVELALWTQKMIEKLDLDLDNLQSREEKENSNGEDKSIKDIAEADPKDLKAGKTPSSKKRKSLADDKPAKRKKKNDQ